MNLREARIDGSKAVSYRFVWKPPHAVATFEIQSPAGPIEYKVFIQWDEGLVQLHFTATDDDHTEGTWEHLNIGVRGAIQVFHTVWAIMLQYFDETEYPIEELNFTASVFEPSRVRFYTTLAYQVADIFEVDPDIMELSRDVAFTIPVAYEPL